MTMFYPDRHAVPRIAAKRFVAPTYDVDHDKLTESLPPVLAVEAIDWHPEGEYPIDNPNDVLIAELEDQFRYNNERAVHKIRNFAALPCETTSQRHSLLACLIAESPTIINQ